MVKIDVFGFVKWAGGKKQLIEQFKPHFPKKIEKYIEPFVGGGAVAFYIIQKYKPKEIILSDINKELINAFRAIRDDVDSLIAQLKQHKEYHGQQAKTYFYEIRKANPEELSKIECAARFIYLNRTCFNGLYRVNSKGKFNVPIGKYKDPDIVQENKLRKISKLLEGVKIKNESFENVLNWAKKGDFVYLDPPYYPLKKGHSFTTYSKDNFLEEEQKKLAEVFRKVDKKGCYVMESNSDTDFIRELYEDFDITVVKASRMINCQGEGRGKINELVIRNY